MPDARDKAYKHIVTTSQLKHKDTLYLSVVSQGIFKEHLHSSNTN